MHTQSGAASHNALMPTGTSFSSVRRLESDRQTNLFTNPVHRPVLIAFEFEKEYKTLHPLLAVPEFFDL